MEQDKGLKELYENSNEIIEYLLENREHSGVCEGCAYETAQSIECRFCIMNKAAADLLADLLKERSKPKPKKEPCPECGKALYSCLKCGWREKRAFTTTIEEAPRVGDYCYKWWRECDDVVKSPDKDRCKHWVLPSNVNYCSHCGRPLRQ